MSHEVTPVISANFLFIRMCRPILAPAVSFRYEIKDILSKFFLGLIFIIAIVAKNWFYYSGGEIMYNPGNITSGTFRMIRIFNH